PGLFTQSDQDRFELASLDVDILCGLANSWLPGATSTGATSTGAGSTVPATRPAPVAQQKRNERMAADIASFLRLQGPQPIGRIRSYLYGRFIGRASADVVIANDSQQRFVQLDGGLVGVRDEDVPQSVTPHTPLGRTRYR